MTTYPNFKARVALAVMHLSGGTGHDREMDACWENCDGDMVAEAVRRRCSTLPCLAKGMAERMDMALIENGRIRFSEHGDDELEAAARAQWEMSCDALGLERAA